jgi:uncharacterized membrane protein YeaQ/YmgE (transglycosylase-associated protein family)
MLVGIIGWIIVGLIAGFIASKVVNLRGDDPRIGMGLGAVAAVVGGWLYSTISGSAVSGFNAWSLLFAAIAATVALVTWHVVRSRATRTGARRSW